MMEKYDTENPTWPFAGSNKINRVEVVVSAEETAVSHCGHCAALIRLQVSQTAHAWRLMNSVVRRSWLGRESRVDCSSTLAFNCGVVN
jgi:hypothetical protein